MNISNIFGAVGYSNWLSLGRPKIAVIADKTLILCPCCVNEERMYVEWGYGRNLLHKKWVNTLYVLLDPSPMEIATAEALCDKVIK